MTDRWLTRRITRLQAIALPDTICAYLLPGDILYWPDEDLFARIVDRDLWGVTVRRSWPIHFYGRLMQVVSAFQCAWRKWREDCP